MVEIHFPQWKQKKKSPGFTLNQNPQALVKAPSWLSRVAGLENHCKDTRNPLIFPLDLYLVTDTFPFPPPSSPLPSSIVFFFFFLYKYFSIQSLFFHSCCLHLNLDLEVMSELSKYSCKGFLYFKPISLQFTLHMPLGIFLKHVFKSVLLKQ